MKKYYLFAALLLGTGLFYGCSDNENDHKSELSYNRLQNITIQNNWKMILKQPK